MIDPTCPRERSDEYRARRDRRLTPGSLEGRAEAAAPTPSWPLDGQPTGSAHYLPVSNPGVGLDAGVDTNPFPAPFPGQVMAVELHQRGTLAVDATFQLNIEGTLVGPIITLPAGFVTKVLAIVGPLAVDAGDSIQLRSVSGATDLDNLGGYVSVVH